MSLNELQLILNAMSSISPEVWLSTLILIVSAGGLYFAYKSYALQKREAEIELFFQNSKTEITLETGIFSSFALVAHNSGTTFAKDIIIRLYFPREFGIGHQHLTDIDKNMVQRQLSLLHIDGKNPVSLPEFSCLKPSKYTVEYVTMCENGRQKTGKLMFNIVEQERMEDQT